MTDPRPRSKGGVRQAVPFFMVEDMTASLRFYVDGVGFTRTLSWVVDEKIRWCWLVLDDVAIMLQEPSPEAKKARTPGVKPGEGVSICFMCDDAIAFYKELRLRGVDAQRPFVGNGLWVTSIRDPDGYRMDFESKTDAPEESEYQG